MNKFIRSVYEMASDEQANSIAVGFSADGLSLELRDVDALAEILPKYFNHNKVASLCRQLNNYGFRKLHPGRLARANSNNITEPKRAAVAITQTFIHPHFQRNRPDLCGQIRRQTANTNKQFAMAEDDSDGGEDDGGGSQPAAAPAAASTSTVELQSALNNAVRLNTLLQQQNLDLMKRIRDLEQAQQKCTCQSSTVSQQQQQPVLPLSFLPQAPSPPIASNVDTTPARASPNSAISARRNSSDDTKLMFEFPPFL